MPDIAEFDPPVGIAEELQPGLRRILAPNASPMTFRGTNTYLLGTRQIAVIDPGPDSEAHLRAIEAALGPQQRISHILITHAHLDHSPLAQALSRRTGAPVLAFGDAGAGRSPVMQRLAALGLAEGGEGVDRDFSPSRCLRDQERIETDEWQITAHWTPGHFGNHLSFAWQDVVFSGDLVMGWASSLVSPPDGDLSDFLNSCQKLLALPARVFHAGHGAPILDPKARLTWLIEHRLQREAQILQALEGGAASSHALAKQIYHDIPQGMLPAATRNVFAHLVDLYEKNRVSVEGELAADAKFAMK